MSLSKFNVTVGDNVVFLGENDSSFNKNDKYRILAINIFGKYPFNEPHQIDLSNKLKNPRVITLKDKNDETFILVFDDDGFANNFDTSCNFEKFDIERRLRKLKLEKINSENE